ncbi:hypothetical protein Tco_0319272 [Tanacetum coccineum]
MDRNSNNGLWDFYVKECNNKGSISDTEPSKDECDEPYNKNQKNSCSDSLFKPYLDAQEGNGIYNFKESNQYSPQIPVSAECDIRDPNDLCKSKEFTVIRYSIGSDEEFITLRPSIYNTWEKPMGACLASTMTSLIRNIADDTYAYIKNHKKTVKKQANTDTRTKERARAGSQSQKGTFSNVSADTEICDDAQIQDQDRDSYDCKSSELIEEPNRVSKALSDPAWMPDDVEEHLIKDLDLDLCDGILKASRTRYHVLVCA